MLHLMYPTDEDKEDGCCSRVATVNSAITESVALLCYLIENTQLVR